MIDVREISYSDFKGRIDLDKAFNECNRIIRIHDKHTEGVEFSSEWDDDFPSFVICAVGGRYDGVRLVQVTNNSSRGLDIRELVFADHKDRRLIGIEKLMVKALLGLEK